MELLYVIPARGGSKGIPHKNIKKLKGIPLIHYAIQQARSVATDENICITTDDPEIIAVSEQTGIKVPFTRPFDLATDSASMQEVLLHAVDFYERKGRIFDAIVLLQPTSPFRSTADIEKAITDYTPDIDMLMTVRKTDANPYYILFEEKDGFLFKSKDGEFETRGSCRVSGHRGCLCD